MSLYLGFANFAMGHSIILHSKPDDCVTQPSGNSGVKLSQGVIGFRNSSYITYDTLPTMTQSATPNPTVSSSMYSEMYSTAYNTDSFPGITPSSTPSETLIPTTSSFNDILASGGTQNVVSVFLSLIFGLSMFCF